MLLGNVGLSFWMFCVMGEPGSELVGMTGMPRELELELIADFGRCKLPLCGGKDFDEVDYQECEEDLLVFEFLQRKERAE